MRRPSAVCAGAFAAAFALACRSGPAQETTLRLAHEADLSSLDPADASDHITISILSNVYDALVDLDPDMKLVPGLAVSWETPEPTTWLFHLRPHVQAHDGRGLDAEDVRASLERARNAPSSALRTLLTSIETVEVDDPTTVRVRTRGPDPLLAVRLVSVYVLPRRAAERAASSPVGTGPYRFVRRAPDLVELEAFPGHWRGRPPVSRAVFVHVPPGPRTLQALASGAVDVLRWVPEDLASRVAALPGVRIVRHPSLRALYLWLNSAPGSAFADPRLRQALSRAIDRDALAARIGAGNVPLWTFVPRLAYGHASEHRLVGDVEAARRLLGQAGHPGGIELPLVHAPGVGRIAEAVAESLSRAGIRARPEAQEWAVLRESWQAARLPLFLGSWRFEAVEASLFLQHCIRTRQPGVDRSWNAGFSSPRLDRMIDENFRLFDAEERQEHFRALWAAMSEEMPVVPLVERLDVYAVRSHVRFKPRGDGNLRVAELAVETP